LGIGNFAAYHGNKGESTGWYGTHNTFTQISSEAGLPALLLIFLVIGTVIRHMKRVSDELADDSANVELRLLARATLVSIVAFVFSGFFAHIAYDYLLYYVLGIGIGVWTVSRQRLEAPPLDVSVPERFLARHPTKRAFQWR